MSLKDELRKKDELKNIYQEQLKKYNETKLAIETNKEILAKLSEGEMTLDNFRWLIKEVLKCYENNLKLWDQNILISESYVNLIDELDKKAVQR